MLKKIKTELIHILMMILVSAMIIVFGETAAECSTDAPVITVNMNLGTVCASAPNYYDKSKQYFLAIAKYSGKRLVSVNGEKIKPYSDICNTSPEPYDGSYEYKAFFWNGALVPSAFTVTSFIANDSADGRVIVNEPFDNLPCGIPFVTASRGNVISPQSGEVMFERKNTSDFHMDVRGAYTTEKSVVYDFEIKILDPEKTSFTVLLKDDNSKYSTVCRVKGGILTAGNKIVNISDGEKHRISAVYDYSERMKKYYADGKVISEKTAFESDFCTDVYAGTFRIYCGNVSDAETAHAKFTVDNIRIYEGNSYIESPGAAENAVILTGKSVLTGKTDMVYADEIKSAYNNSALKNVHPRIQASKKDFDRIRTSVQTDSYMKKWYDEVLAHADELLKNSQELKYELRDGVRLLYVSRECLQNMYTLGMAYQLTGESKYADRAWFDLYTVCSFPDWHPKHDLDTAEMCAAVAIGYDWMYDAFSASQRRIIEDAIFQKGFCVYALAYQTADGIFGAGVTSYNNHNAVLNGGAVMSALAFMDVYPDVCRYIASNAVSAAKIMFKLYADDGSWYEGPHYWEYAVQYSAKLISSLSGVLGSGYSLDEIGGFKKTAEYALEFQSDCGIFNYGDGVRQSFYVPEMYWLGNKYNDKRIAETVLSMSGGETANAEDSVLSLLWYDAGTQKSDEFLPRDALYSDEGAVFRNAWFSDGMIFAAVHAGYTSRKNGMTIYHSQLDAGTFVYDYGGIRWAEDLGMAPLDLPETADYSEFGARWNMYKARAEAHNTIVVNPGLGPDHSVLSRAEITRFESGDNGAIAVVDMSDVLRENTVGAKRGLFFTDNRTSLVVRDEIKLKNASDVYWFMQTTADAEVSGNTVTLSKGGKKVKLEYICNKPSVITVEESKPLPASPTVNNDTIPNAKRIKIHVNSDENVNITVKLTPFGMGETDVNAYDTDIGNWKI